MISTCPTKCKFNGRDDAVANFYTFIQNSNGRKQMCNEFGH